MKSYLINLNKDSERLSFFKSNFNRLKIDFERVDAVDGRLFSEQEYQNFLQDRPRNNKSWARGQMGCFLSHYSVWQKIAMGEHTFCAVFEDDIHISDDLKTILADERWTSDNMDIIRLETSTNRVCLTSKPIVTHAHRPVYGVNSTSWCAGGYIINRRTARILVNLPTKHHEPADVILYNFTDSAVANKFNILQFNPAPCTQDKHLIQGSIKFSSNIESPLTKKEILIEKLKLMSPVVILRALCRSILGYKRIGFK